MINIQDSDFNKIMSRIGYPIVTLEDLGLTREDINTIIIDPAMDYYFTFFPQITESVYEVGTYINVEFPRETTFTAIDVRINPNIRIGGSGGWTRSPLVNEYNFSTKSSFSRNMWNTGNDYGFAIVKGLNELERQAQINNLKTFHFDIDEINRKITGYTSTVGTLQIKWADKALDWNEIPLFRKKDAIDICQIYLLEYFGDLRNQAVSSMPVEMSGEVLLSRASELREKLETRWHSMTKTKIMRG